MRASFVDRALGAVGLRRAPRAAQRPRPPRVGTPAPMAAYGAGAGDNRLVHSWQTPTLSANQEIALALRLSRDRARALVQNNGYASGVVTEIVNNVVGPEGIQLRAQTRTRSGELAKATNYELERAFRDWGVPELASADHAASWVDLQRLIVETLVVDGEVFVRPIRGADNAHGFTLELIDADCVDENYNRRPSAGQHEIRMGVELGAHNRPVAYWCWTQHPSEPGKRDRVRVSADDLWHLFVRRRVGQVRGMTWFAPVVLPFHMLGEYETAEITAARWAASKLGIWTPNEHADLDEDAPKEVPLDAPPGSTVESPYGYTFSGYDPQHPNANAAAFIGVIMRGIARGLNVSTLTLTGDLTGANYSSMRAGLLPERDHWRALQRWLSTHLHRRVYPAWLAMALLAGMVRVDSRLAATYTDVAWKARGWQWVDPLKDIQAWERRIKLGGGSRTRMVAEQGDDYEEIVDELHDEEDYARTEGVDVSGVDARASTAAAAARGAREGATDDDAGDEDDSTNGDARATSTRLRAV